MRKPILLTLFFLCVSTLRAAKTLDVYFIDVEGGQSTLFVSPSGESMLVDTGWSNFNGRDADRIVAAAKLAGVKQIDYLVITHYHEDHVGGVPQLAARIPILNVLDHGRASRVAISRTSCSMLTNRCARRENTFWQTPATRSPSAELK